MELRNLSSLVVTKYRSAVIIALAFSLLQHAGGNVPRTHFDCTGNSIATVVPPGDFWGQTAWNVGMTYNYAAPVSSGPDSNGNYCHTKGTTGNGDAYVTTTEVRLPRWPAYSNRCSEEQTEWDAFYQHVSIHEDGHVQVNNDWMADVNTGPPGTTNRASFITLVTSISVTGSGSTAQAAEDDADQKFEDELESIGSDLRSSVRSAHDAYHDDVGTNGDPDRSISCS